MPPARITALALEAMEEKACVGDKSRYDSCRSAGCPGSFSKKILPSELRFVKDTKNEDKA